MRALLFAALAACSSPALEPDAGPDADECPADGLFALTWECREGCHTDAPFIYWDTVELLPDGRALWRRDECELCAPGESVWPAIPFADSADAYGCEGEAERDGRVWGFTMTPKRGP